MIKNEQNELTLEQILAADDLQAEAVTVPEWGGVVYVRGLSGNARDELEAYYNDVGLVGFRAQLAARGMCDSDGRRLNLTEKQINDLGDKAASAVARIAERVQALSGMTDSDVEELEKNSEADPNAGSG